MPKRRKLQTLPCWISIAASLIATAGWALANPAPVTLRYQYKPGKTLQYAFTEVSTSTVKPSERPEVTEYKQTSLGTDRKTVVSFEGGHAIIDEMTTKGNQERTDARGTSSQVIQAVTRRYTFTPLGKFVRVERKPPGGQPDPGPQPLDGLTFSLPEKPVSEGTFWSETLSIVGLDGKPMTVKATSTYRGARTRQSHPADQVDVTFGGTFTISGKLPNPPVEGSLSGKLTYYLARDIGQEVEVTNEATLVFKMSPTIQGKTQPFTRTIKMASTKTLAK